MGVLMSKEFKKATAGAFDRDVKAEPESSSGRAAKRRKFSGPEFAAGTPSNAKKVNGKSDVVKARRAQSKKLQASEQKDDGKKGGDAAGKVDKAATSGKGASATTTQVKPEELHNQEQRQDERDGNNQERTKDQTGNSPASAGARTATRSSKRKREPAALTPAPTNSISAATTSPSPLPKDLKPESIQETLHPAYTYSKTAIPGVTHLYTSREEPSQYRHIKSEYTLPILRLARNTPPPPPPSERVSSSYFPPEPVVLIQNSIAHSLYALLVQAILWNQTTGKQARPVLDELLRRYPDPKTLAEVDQEELAELLQPIGLFNSRAKRLRDLASTWVEKPPLPGRGYTKTRDRKYTDVPIVVSLPLENVENYDDDEGGDEDAEGEEVDEEMDEGGEEDAEGEEIDEDDEDFQPNSHVNSQINGNHHPSTQTKPNTSTIAGTATTTNTIPLQPDLSPELLRREAHSQSDPNFWEIAHLPGVGPYALDSFRIFHRDEMRGLASDHLGAGAKEPDFEPEWRRVVPLDKDLRLYVRYLWEREGWEWDPLTGRKKRKVVGRGRREVKSGK